MLMEAAADRHLRKKLQVEFVGEPGLDAGGLAKEWFLLMAEALLDPALNLFDTDPETQLKWFKLTEDVDQASSFFFFFIVLLWFAAADTVT